MCIGSINVVCATLNNNHRNLFTVYLKVVDFCAKDTRISIKNLKSSA